MAKRKRLGDMLVAAGMVTEEQVIEGLEEQRRSGKRLGETLVGLGLLTESEMTLVLSNQLSVPWVNLYHVDFSRELLELVPSSVAEKHGLIPVYVRRVRSQGDTLYLAMEDPLNLVAMQEVADGSGLPVKPMVAAPTDIRNAIRVYYLGLPPLEEAEETEVDLSEAYEPLESVSELELDPVSAPAPPHRPPGVVTPSVPPPPRPGPGFLTLTLLDGTQVKLPAMGRPHEAAPPADRLTTRDLIHALRARAGGADVSDVLPEGSWEPILAALLSVLLRKRLIADWEFVDEWSKQRKRSEPPRGGASS